jgi:Tol biopolymer transport system component
MRANGSGQHRLTSDAPGFRDYQPNFTPDGRHIVFARCQPNDGVCAIWIMRSDGTHKRAITPYKQGAHEAVDFFASVSPNGRWVAYAAFGQNGISVQTRLVRLDGTHNHPISPPRLEAASPDWGPKGAHVTFTSNVARVNNNIYSMRPDGGDSDQLTNTRYPNNNFGSVYSPGGRRIAFSSDRRYDDFCCLDLFLMDVDGSHEHQVTTGLFGVNDVVWGSAPQLPVKSATAPSRRPTEHPPSGNRNNRCVALPRLVANVMC